MDTTAAPTRRRTDRVTDMRAPLRRTPRLERDYPLLPVGKRCWDTGPAQVPLGHGDDEGEDMRAVRFDGYGGVDVLEVREVDDPLAGPGQVLVAVKAAGINPGEMAIREGRMH